MSVHPPIHPSVCPHLGGGGVSRARSRQGGGVPKPCPAKGVPQLGGTLMGVPWVPHQTWGVPQLGDPDGGYPRYPPSDLHGGYLTGGYPRYPPSDLDGGYPDGGCTPIGVPQQGGYRNGGYPPLWLTDGVLDKRWSVCLLHSHRRTFLSKQLYCGYIQMFSDFEQIFWHFSVQCRKVTMHQCYASMLKQTWGGGTRKTQNCILGGGDHW